MNQTFGGSQELRVSSMSWEADGVLSLVLVSPNGAALPAWQPGAHVDLCLPSGDVRQYSLCGDPSDLAQYRVAVLREQPSRGASHYVHERLRPGHSVTVTGPRNNFQFGLAERYLFIAGGIGITPLLPMVRQAESNGAEWTLLYGGRRRVSMAFLDELGEFGSRVVVRPQEEFGLLDLHNWLGEPGNGLKVYCCGPEPLLAAVEDLCALWPANSLQIERFTPKSRRVDSGPGKSFDVICNRSGERVTVGSRTSVLEALRTSGLDLPSSCEEGVCGTCETRILEGAAEHRDSVLSATERESNESMLICVSRAESDVLVLDL